MHTHNHWVVKTYVFINFASTGNLKNLIFAPNGKLKKPDIVIEDSINNELRLADDASNCLMYNFKPNADGLKLNELIDWWKEEGAVPANEDAEKSLYIRLRSSLDSTAEKKIPLRLFRILSQ